MLAKIDHSAIALEYCNDIISGNILACNEVIQACQRHVDDLARQSTPGFLYRFDAEKGNRVCRFAERFKIFEGPLAGQQVRLMPWQCFLYISLFGWLVDDPTDVRHGKRKIRKAYVCMPRGNSKSTTAAFLLLYMLAFDGEGASQVITAGATKTVADIPFKHAKNFAENNRKLMDAAGIQIRSLAVSHPKTASKLWASPALVKAMDGKNGHLILLEEFHSLEDRAIYDSLKTSMGKRDNNLFLMITTAGVDTSTVCFETHQYAQGVLNKTYKDEQMFAVVYTLPDGMDWRDPVGHKAANPGWGITVMPDAIEMECQQSKLTPSAQNNFKTKYLCQWVSSGNAWMNMEKWNISRDCKMRIEDFEGQPCIIGLDLASKIDIAGKVYLFWKMIDGQKHYYVFTQSYLPSATVNLGTNASYPAWEIEGRLTVHAGDIIEFDLIRDDIIADAKRFAVKEVAYDPHKAGVLAEQLIKKDIPLCEVRQNVGNLSIPMKELEALVYSGRLHHNCPILDWMMSNVEVKPDQNGNIFPRKARKQNKIDLVSATLDALARAMFFDEAAREAHCYVF